MFLIVFLLSFFIFSSTVHAEDYQLDRPLEFEVLDDGEVLVVDGGGSDWTTEGSEVFIFKDNQVVWNYNQDLIFAHSAHLFSSGLIVVTDTTNDRIIAIDRRTKQIKWSSEDWSGGTGQLSDGSHLDYPNEALEIEDGKILVTDRNNDRILEVNDQGEIFWSYQSLNRPHNASKIDEQTFLVSDSEENRVLKIDKKGKVLWEFGEKKLNWPRDVAVLKNGNYLITDTRNHRVVEVADGEIVWEYKKDLYWPYEAEELENNNILISDSQNKRLIEVNKNGKVIREIKDSQKPVFDSFQNGGFEEINNNNFVNWIKADLVAEGAGEFKIDKEIKKSGQYSGRIDYSGDGNIFYLQKAKINPGENYSFSGWIKTDLDKEDNSWGRYEIWWETDKGGFIDPPLISQKTFGKEDWIKREWQGKAPQEAKAVNIRGIVSGQGTVWFDDVVFEKEKKAQNNFVYFAIGLAGVIVPYFIFSKRKRLT